MRGKKSDLVRGRRWLAAFLAVLWRRPVAVSWLTDGGSNRRRRWYFFSVFPWSSRFVFVSSPSLLFSSPFFDFFSFFFSFSSLSVLLLLLLLSLSSLRSLSFGSFSSLPATAVLGAIYRASECGFCCGAWGAGLAAAGRPFGCYCRGSAPPAFWQARGGWLASVFGRWSNGVGLRVGGLEERAAGLKKKTIFLPSSASRPGKKKKGEQCRSKRYRSVLFFFFFFYVWNDVVLDKTRRFN